MLPTTSSGLRHKSRRQREGQNSSLLRFLIILTVDAVALYFLLNQPEEDILRCRNLPRSDAVCDSKAPELTDIEKIPRIVHFAYGFGNDSVPFDFLAFLSIRAANARLQPTDMFLYCEMEPTGPWFEEARRFVQVVRIEPYETAFGRPIEHGRDRENLVLLKALLETGGIALQLRSLLIDTIALPENGRVILAAHHDGKGVSDALIAAPPRALFIEQWIRTYKIFTPTSLWEGQYHIYQVPHELAAIHTHASRTLNRTDVVHLREPDAWRALLISSPPLPRGALVSLDVDPAQWPRLNELMPARPADVWKRDCTLTRMARQYIPQQEVDPAKKAEAEHVDEQERVPRQPPGEVAGGPAKDAPVAAGETNNTPVKAAEATRDEATHDQATHDEGATKDHGAEDDAHKLPEEPPAQESVPIPVV